MFFIFGISSKEKDLDFSQTTICKTCGSYGRLEAFMTYTYFSLFFIPIIKWNKKYFIRSTCCGTIYSIEEELGKSIERGRNVIIEDSDLININRNYEKELHCKNCGRKIEESF